MGSINAELIENCPCLVSMEFGCNLHHSRFMDTFPHNSGIKFADLSEVIPAPNLFSLHFVVVLI